MKLSDNFPKRKYRFWAVKLGHSRGCHNFKEARIFIFVATNNPSSHALLKTFEISTLTVFPKTNAKTGPLQWTNMHPATRKLIRTTREAASGSHSRSLKSYINHFLQVQKSRRNRTATSIQHWETMKLHTEPSPTAPKNRFVNCWKRSRNQKKWKMQKSHTGNQTTEATPRPLWGQNPTTGPKAYRRPKTKKRTTTQRV